MIHHDSASFGGAAARHRRSLTKPVEKAKVALFAIRIQLAVPMYHAIKARTGTVRASRNAAAVPSRRPDSTAADMTQLNANAPDTAPEQAIAVRFKLEPVVAGDAVGYGPEWHDRRREHVLRRGTNLARQVAAEGAWGQGDG